jgi:(S)-3,5-dihydroxyphenylglycine transaminase
MPLETGHMRRLVELDKATLHSSLCDPVLDSINFLNEVMDRYPRAISFAPGAPNTRFLDDLDVSAAISRYRTYLIDEKGLSETQVNRHLYQYGPSRGLINELVANTLQNDQGIKVAPESIVITVGCQEAILLALRALFASPTDLLAATNPCFSGMVGAARLLDVNIVPIDETDAGIDCDRLVEACRNARAVGNKVKALYVAPDFANPSGSMLDLETRERLLAVAAQESVLLLEDNAYAFTSPHNLALPTLKALDRCARVIYLGTFAKVCLPGARVGFVVADQAVRDSSGRPRLLADELAALKSMVTVNTSPVSQAIIAGMLLEHGCSLTSLSEEKNALYQRNLRLLLEALNRHLAPESGFPYRVSWNTPRGGFFVRLRLPVEVDNKLLQISADEYGVLWTPMRHFHLDASGNDYLRLSCSYLSPEHIEDGIRRLALFLRDPRVRPAPVSQGGVDARAVEA